MRGVGRVVVAVNVAGWVSLAVTTAAVVAVLLASAHAPPPVDQRPMDYDEAPGAVAADAVYNLRASEYSYAVRVEDTGDREVARDEYGTGMRLPDAEIATTAIKRVRIDNPARRYRARITFPVLFDGDPQWVQYYAEGPSGHTIVPPGADPPFGSGGTGYALVRNAFDRGGLADANATVVADNRTTYVVRITDDEAAMEAGYPGGAYSTRLPTAEATANLTITIEKATGHVTAATFRYRHHGTARHVRATFAFEGYGGTSVGRPLLAGPPGVIELLYRLDLGLWALESLQWRHVGGGFAALLAAGLLVERALRRGPW